MLKTIGPKGTPERLSSPSKGRTAHWPRLPASLFFMLLWSLMFGSINAYWAMGGRAGEGTIGTAIESHRNEVGLNLLLWVAAVVKWLIGIGLLRLYLKGPGKVLYFLLLSAGIAITAYGVYCIAFTTRIQLFQLPIPESIGREAFWWHVWVWNPIWLSGGVTLIYATLLCKKRRKRISGIELL